MYYNLGVIIFDSVRFLSKNNNQTDFFKKKTKTGLAWFFLIWLGLSSVHFFISVL